jgi:hypothetical protein|tara:strand:+ start:1223 stop:1444 length:222 start_codon:yes stop_codon:yes gene_type:complete
MNHLRTFVVGCAAPIKSTASLLRLERRGIPKIERIGRLDIVVPIDHKMRPRGIPSCRQQHRMNGSLDDIDLEP